MEQTNTALEIMATCIEQYCPEQANTLLQLRHRLAANSEPIIAAIGDYNVGKSSLLNALIGQDVFAVSDRRETRCLSRHLASGICWIDTPGLDADLTEEDDRQAREALQQADLLLFLHNACNGELSPKQLVQLHSLRQDAAGAEVKLVLTRIDECQPAAREQIADQVRRQAEGIPILQVSSQRYRAGLTQQLATLVDLSGIPALQDELAHWGSNLPAWRAKQQRSLIAKLGDALQQRLQEAQTMFNQMAIQQQQRRQNFSAQLQPLLRRLAQLI